MVAKRRRRTPDAGALAELALAGARYASSKFEAEEKMRAKAKKRTKAAKKRANATPATRRTVADTGGQVADIADPVSLAEAVALTGLSERTLRRRMKAGRLRHKREGGLCLLSRAELRLLAKGRGHASAMADTKADTGRDVARELSKLTGRLEQLEATKAASMADTGGQVSDRIQTAVTDAVQALTPMFTEELTALRRQNEGLHGLVVDLQRQLAESRLLLTSGDVEKDRELTERTRELSELRADKARLETSRRWALVLAGVLVVAAALLAVVGVR